MPQPNNVQWDLNGQHSGCYKTLESRILGSIYGRMSLSIVLISKVSWFIFFSIFKREVPTVVHPFRLHIFFKGVTGKKILRNNPKTWYYNQYLTHLMPLVSFYTPRKQKTSGGTKRANIDRCIFANLGQSCDTYFFGILYTDQSLHR